MDFIDDFLEYIKRTNPDMSREKLIEELNCNAYTSYAFALVYGEIEQNKKPTEM